MNVLEFGGGTFQTCDKHNGNDTNDPTGVRLTTNGINCPLTCVTCKIERDNRHEQSRLSTGHGIGVLV